MLLNQENKAGVDRQPYYFFAKNSPDSSDMGRVHCRDEGGNRWSIFRDSFSVHIRFVHNRFANVVVSPCNGRS